jgi:hypothetical protein
VLPEVPHRDALDRVVDELVADQAGRQDLSAVGKGGKPRRAVDAESDQALPGLLGTAGVESHADLDGRVLGPWLGGQRALRRDGRLDGVGRLVERHEQGVTLGSLLDSTVGLGSSPEDLTVTTAQLGVAVTPDGLLDARRALDVAEQEGERAARQHPGSSHPWGTPNDGQGRSVTVRSRTSAPCCAAVRGASTAQTLPMAAAHLRRCAPWPSARS